MLDVRRNKQTRHKVAVILDLGEAEGEELAYMFIAPSQRVTDVLNDERDFLPFERADGSVFAVAKRIIRRITPMEMGRKINEKDPYDLLGLTPAATDEQVHGAYHRLVAAVHPDRVQSLGLPEDFLELARRRAALLNEAYRRVKAVRRAEQVGM